ncbi:ABC transporter permease [Phytohabitans kaempferiae]|uniref:ABC transporter permease n=1 Tax=Phytohabitans kaempferiae TaxID=1620943 RepID=A0ABV6M3A1_9ACTN
MIRFVLRRLLLAVPLALGVVTLMFILLELAPGDPVQAMLGDYPATPEYIAQLRAEYGLDKSLPERYLAYLGNVFTGDLGYSYSNRQEVSVLIGDRLGATLLLTLTGLTFAALVALLLGTWAGTSKRPFADHLITGGAVAAFSIPAFWLGQLLLIVFAVELGWLPVSGMTSVRSNFTGLAHVRDVALHLLLPVIALSMREIGAVSRIARTSVKDVLSRNHILTAQAKGLSRRAVIRGHVTRNALLPTLTVIGYSFGFALSGSVLIETVFGWPGMGRLLYQSIVNHDNQVVIGVVLAIAAAVLLANLITDILYAVVDPRIRLTTTEVA